MTGSMTAVFQKITGAVGRLDFSDKLAILGIVITLVLAIAVPLIKFWYDKNKQFKVHFRIIWHKSSSLKPEEITDHVFQEYYHRRPTDDLISKALTDKKNTLVVGRPLSGKTRAVFQALKGLGKSYDVLVPRHTNIDVEKYSLPSHFSFWQRPKLIFIDDLQIFAEQQNFEYLFELADKNKIVIVATCQSEDKYNKAEARILHAKNTSLTTIFGENTINIREITEDTAKEVTEKVGKKWSEIRFDGTIGSVFMPFYEMRQRFLTCDETEINILLALKKLYIAGIYRERNSFPLEWVKTIARKDGTIGQVESAEKVFFFPNFFHC